MINVKNVTQKISAKKLILIGAALSIFSGSAFAVDIDLNAGLAMGSILESKQTQNHEIGCEVIANDAAGDREVRTLTGFCFAFDGENSFTCETNNKTLVDVILSIQPHSYLMFKHGRDMECASITLTNASWYYNSF